LKRRKSKKVEMILPRMQRWKTLPKRTKRHACVALLPLTLFKQKRGKGRPTAEGPTSDVKLNLLRRYFELPVTVTRANVPQVKSVPELLKTEVTAEWGSWQAFTRNI
jgi:hypothetical protein